MSLDNPLTEAELAAFRARQKSRSRALALVLIALVVLFFAITLVKLRAESVRYAQERQQLAAPNAITPAPMAQPSLQSVDPVGTGEAKQ